MGWGSGTGLMAEVIYAVDEYVESEEVRTKVYTLLIQAFEDRDWDGIDEMMGIDPAFDQAARKIHPGWFNEIDEEVL